MNTSEHDRAKAWWDTTHDEEKLTHSHALEKNMDQADEEAGASTGTGAAEADRPARVTRKIFMPS